MSEVRPEVAEKLRTVVADAFPDADLRSAAEVEQGKNTAYFLTVESGEAERELVCKVGDHHSAAGCRAESFFLERVGERTAIPVPDVLGTGELDSDPYFLAERVSGENYECEPDRLEPESFEQVCVEAGRNLGELHAAFPAEKFGLLGVETGRESIEFVREFPNWPSYFEVWLTHNAARLEATRFADLAPAVEERAESLADEFRDLGPFDPVITHNDYRLGNLLLNPETRTESERITNVVLDWATPAAAPVEYELAVTEAILVDWPEFDAERQQTLRELLYEGYRETNDGALNRETDDFEARRRLYRFGARLRLMVNLEEEMAGRSAEQIEARATEHHEVLRDGYDLH